MLRNHLILRVLALLMLAQAPLCLGAQHLKRRARLGAQLAPVSDSLAQALKLPPQTGLQAVQVFPGTSFDVAGLRSGEVFLRFDDHPVNSWAELQPLLADRWEGEPFTVTVRRKGKDKVLKGTLVGAPKEASTDRREVMYDEVAWEGGYLRAIVSRSTRPGPHPTIYFIPGYNCMSLDNLPPFHPYRKMMDTLEALDYTIFRLEKPGMGDGPNPCDCRETGFYKELSAYAAGYQHMLRYDFVREEEVFLFGHSMGGVHAPLLAAQPGISPRGIAVYGTVYQRWYEYILAMLRFQEPRTGENMLAFEDDMEQYIRLFYAHYVEMKPISEIRKNQRWVELLERDFALDAEDNILWRKAFYWREIAEQNLTAAWSATEAHVLSMYGEADFEVFNPFSMEEIVNIVEASHPGKGQFLRFPGTDHSMIQVGSMEEGVAMRGTPAYRQRLHSHYNFEIPMALHTWITGILQQ